MSYILDALKKSEQERNLGKVPTLADLGQEPLLASYSNAGRNKWLISGILGLFAVSIVVFFFMTNGKPEAVSDLAQSKERHAEEDSHTQETKSPPNNLQSEFSLPPDQNILSIKDNALRMSRNSIAANIEGIKKQDQVEQQADEWDEVFEERLPDMAVNIEPHEDSLLAIEPEVMPFQEAQSDSLMNMILPDLTLDIHVYDASQSERFVYINMKKYREGDLTDEGLSVESIDSEGVILALDGEQFRLPINQ